MKKGGSRTPSSLTSFHFSPVFLRSMAGGGGPAFGFPSTGCACAPSHALCIPESRWKGTVQRARLGGGEGKGVMHSGS